MKTTAQLWKATGINLCVSVLLYSCLLGLLWVAELLVPALRGQLLHFDSVEWCVGIPASIVGVGYILSVRDPQNYTGFYPGILMSVLLGVQFFLQGQYDSTILFFCVFVPFQIKSVISWSKPAGDEEKDKSFAPEFLSTKAMLLSLLVFVLLTAADYLFVTYHIQHDSLADDIWIKLINGFLISSSILANFWLIYRKNDAWIYWVVYSLAGIGLFVLINNIFSIVLFVFFLIINSTAAIAWFRRTPRENYGWLAMK